jgi:hypothetical protein
MIINSWMAEESCQLPARENVLPLFTSVEAESGYLPIASVSGVLSPERTGAGVVKMTNQSNLRPRLWSSGVTPPLPEPPSWCTEGKFAFAFEKIVGNA